MALRGSFPKKNNKDEKLVDLARAAAVSGITTIATISTGSPLVSLAAGQALGMLDFVLKPALEKRRVEWFEQLDGDLRKLDEKVEGLEGKLLLHEDILTTITINATQIALRSHQKEKIDALRSSILNTAKSVAPDEDQALMFLGVLDTLTASHLRVLKVFKRLRGISFTTPLNSGGENVYLSTVSTVEIRDMFTQVAMVLKRSVPELEGEFLRQILKDLLNKGLIEEIDGNIHEPFGNLNVQVGPPQSKDSSLVLSGFGRNFLDFIASPL